MNLIKEEFLLDKKEVQEIFEFSKRFKNLYIVHTGVKEIWDAFNSLRDHKRIGGDGNTPRNLFLTGKSGVGKTKLAEKYVKMNDGYTETDETGTEIDVRPVAYMELPNPFTIGSFYMTIIKALGAPVIGGSIKTLKDQALTLIEKQKVELFIFDEMDYLLTSSFVDKKKAMETFKHISNLAKCSIVCIGTEISSELRKINFQYFRRFAPRILDRFEECNDDFKLFLNNIEEELSPPFALDLSGEVTANLLFKQSFGLIGLLIPIIEEAFRLMGVFKVREIGKLFSKFNGTLLLKACKNVVGDIQEEEFIKMLENNIVKL